MKKEKYGPIWFIHYSLSKCSDKQLVKEAKKFLQEYDKADKKGISLKDYDNKWEPEAKLLVSKLENVT